MTTTTLRAQVALAEIEAMGLTLGDLLAAAGRVTTPQPTCPTVGDYVQVVAEGYQPRSRRTYNSYWRLTVESSATSPSTRSPSMTSRPSLRKPPAAPSNVAPAATAGEP